MIIRVKRGSLLAALSVIIVLVIAGSFLFLFTPQESAPPPVNPGEEGGVLGEYLSWTEVNKLFPKYASGTVIDFETGRKFRVQRRAGSAHADVQPLSAADTQVMKDIYGKWSWKRRAVLLELPDGRLIAASMNGMPHGSGAIKGNKFNGHFCLHFRDSKTHSSRKSDLAHQLMVWKAAGLVHEQLPSLTEEETINAFFTALEQGDMGLAQYVVAGELLSDSVKPKEYQYINVESITKTGENTFSVHLRTSQQGSRKEEQMDLQLILIPGPYWRIEADTLDGLFIDSTLRMIAFAYYKDFSKG